MQHHSCHMTHVGHGMKRWQRWRRKCVPFWKILTFLVCCNARLWVCECKKHHEAATLILCRKWDFQWKGHVALLQIAFHEWHWPLFVVLFNKQQQERTTVNEWCRGFPQVVWTIEKHILQSIKTVTFELKAITTSLTRWQFSIHSSLVSFPVIRFVRSIAIVVLDWSETFILQTQKTQHQTCHGLNLTLVAFMCSCQLWMQNASLQLNETCNSKCTVNQIMNWSSQMVTAFTLKHASKSSLRASTKSARDRLDQQDTFCALVTSNIDTMTVLSSTKFQNWPNCCNTLKKTNHGQTMIQTTNARNIQSSSHNMMRLEWRLHTWCSAKSELCAKHVAANVHKWFPPSPGV